MNLLALLADKGLITPAQVGAFDEEARTTGRSIEEVLQKNGVALDSVLSAKGAYYNLPTRLLGDQKVPFEILRYIPEESAAHYSLVPLSVTDGVLEVGLVDPDNIEARDALNFITGKVGLPYKIFLINETDFASVLKQYRGLTGEVGRALNELESELDADNKALKGSGFEGDAVESISSSDVIKKDDTASGNEEGIQNITEDAPVTKIVATMLRYALEGGASDIHIEPLASQSRVRFRVDGVLTTSLTLPSKVHPAVIARIKVLSNMRLDERRKPQDGRFSAHIDNKKVDFRVSSFPTYYGEKIVMRLLGLAVKKWTLDDMGLSEHDLALVREAIKKPFGMVLISGPTGSGKSTTLYAMLNEVDREHHNVLSLEDPIEYNIDGVAQSQVRPEIGYTFATGLRTTLRQDPDIIMVGEIRDKETAQLAVQAALTGHLVLSTIHTNNSVGIVPRLLDMGVDPFLIPPTLILGIAQRLVRTLCPGGGERVEVEGSLQEMLTTQFADLPERYKKKLPKMDAVYRAHPTPECPNGMRGRTAAFEVMEMGPELEKAILNHASEDELYAIARKNGMLTMKEHAIIKSIKGEVPFEEVNTLGGTFEIDEDVETDIASDKRIEEEHQPAKENGGE